MEISKKTSTYIKGVCAITVLLSHIIAYSGIGNGSKIVSLIIGMMGYLSVAIFFFLSGYGLMVSYKHKGSKYIESLPKRRILPYYLKYLVVCLVYLLIRTIIGIETEPLVLAKSLFYGGTIVKFGWYLQTQLVLYLIFFCGFKLNHTHPVRIIFFLTALFWLLCVFIGLDTTYYMTTPSFLFGVVWPTIIHKPIMRKSGYSFFLFIAIWLIATPFDEPINAYIRCGIAPIFLIVSFVDAVVKIRHESNVVEFLGRYSYEIYVVQGAVILLLQTSIVSIENQYMLMLLSFVLTIVLSVPLHKLFELIDRRTKKIW